MRFYLEVDYDEDHGEDAGRVLDALADVVYEQEGVSFVRAHGPEATLIPSPERDSIEKGGL